MKDFYEHTSHPDSFWKVCRQARYVLCKQWQSYYNDIPYRPNEFQPAIFPLSTQVIRFHELPAEATLGILQ